MALGYRPGPEFKAILNDLLDARLDDQVHNRDEEIALLRRTYPPDSLAAAGPRAYILYSARNPAAPIVAFIFPGIS